MKRWLLGKLSDLCTVLGISSRAHELESDRRAWLLSLEKGSRCTSKLGGGLVLEVAHDHLWVQFGDAEHAVRRSDGRIVGTLIEIEPAPGGRR